MSSQRTREPGIQAGHEMARAKDHRDYVAYKEMSQFEELQTGSLLGKFALYIIVAYLATGCAFYSIVEGWDWLDALYFSVVTMTSERPAAKRSSTARCRPPRPHAQ